MQFKLDQPDYPRLLRQLLNPPPVLTTSGPLDLTRRAIAIVGSRRATPGSLAFAHELAFGLAKAGLIVVSGGADGVDGAAHRGALAAGGATWVVSPTGKDQIYPPKHRDLFAEVASSAEGRMIWPFPDDHEMTRDSFLYRNGILAAVSEALVVVQAHVKSGSRNAVSWARDLGRPVWAVTASPWMSEYAGSALEIELGRAQPLCSSAQLMRALGLAPRRVPQLRLRLQNSARARAAARIPAAPPEPLDKTSWTPEENLIYSELWTDPMHMDQIIEATGLLVPPAATALLTLALKDVVVEGPNGFFRRRSA